MKRLGIALSFASLLVVGVGLLLLGLGLGWLLPNPWQAVLPPATAPATDTRPAPLARVIAQGKLQPAGGMTNIFAPPGARISELLVTAGEEVEAGRELLRYTGQRSLELQAQLAVSRTADLKLELQQQLLVAEGNVATAAAAVRNAEWNLEQAEAEPALATERERLDLARNRLAGLQQLAGDPDTAQLISPLALAEQKLELEAAERELQRTERKLAATKKSLQMALELSRQNLTTADQSLSLARQALQSTQSAELSERLAEQQLAESRLVAPRNGKVLRVNARQGEIIGSTPVLQLGASGALECVAEVNDSLVAQVKLGQGCKLLSPALPRPLRGTVSEIGRFVGFPSLRDPDPLALVDRRAVEVKIAIATDDVVAAIDLLNLQVTVEIDVESR